MKASLKKRLRKIEEELASFKRVSLIEVFFIPEGCEDVPAFRARCTATARKNRSPLFVEFVGPAGGPELGTGPLGEDAEQEPHDHT
ncbi:hypothetical protein [Methylobacterium sp. P1-11]|uniref:hypothetical protein n=1 Tax=Methylobacterium sp. P1-11 TaxID=2024616 RepID=UPI0011F04D56|nr:hypothetical protein [Methylobacterium sp. P1-11]